MNIRTDHFPLSSFFSTVAVNGQMAFEFKHRMDPNLIDALEITGAQMITSIQYEFL